MASFSASTQPMWEYLPREIWERILLKQSIKTLVLCSSVCKEWMSLITDPFFISAHLNRTIKANNSSQHLLLRLWRFTVKGLQDSFSLLLDNEQLDFVSKVEYPLSDYCLAKYSCVVGTCNGLVCIHNLDVGFILWNPSIRRYMVLLEPIVNTHTGEFIKNYGFGFDSKNNNFKVVRLVSYLDKPSSPEVEVYSLATRRWKSFTGCKAPLFMLKTLVIANANQMFTDGVLQWAVIRNQLPHENFIMTFDLVEETFGEIMLPESLRGNDINVSVLGGGDLLIVIHSFSPPSFRPFRVEYFNVWVMKEYGNVESWTRVYTGIANSQSRPIGFIKNGDVLLHCHSSGEVVAINEENMRSDREKLRIKGYGYASLSYYVESLYLLDQRTDGVISY